MRVELWRFLAGVVFCLFLMLGGSILATNFRGATTRLARRSMIGADWTRRVPEWRWLPEYNKRLDHGVPMARAVGATGAAAGTVLLIVAITQRLS